MVVDTMPSSNQTLSGPPLGDVIPNIATLVELNAERFAARIVFREKRDGVFTGPDWKTFANTIRTIATHLNAFGFRQGDKLAIVSPNRTEMLALELAVMSCGGVAVPIFSNYPAHILGPLIDFSQARFLAVAGATQLQRLDKAVPVERIFVFDDVQDARFPLLTPYTVLTESVPYVAPLLVYTNPNEVCLNQYTSGTTGTPKLVQLTHRNILSQQAAMKRLWTLNADDRFLSYLPWHHSFGGIFELFSALTSGATMSLESSYGKDPQMVFENWKLVRPTVFFSVPKVYQSLVDLTRADDSARDAFFHPEIKFVFTAAAPLPELIAKEFVKRHVRIIEGWGLTETSPCCTITGADSLRQKGVVGFPIPGVSVRLADDGEIQVHGPNVMTGYLNNHEENAKVFTTDGWFRTGDIGAFEEAGLRLVGRRDRIFKLSNGEKVVTAELESMLQSACHYLAFAVVEGRERDFPVALLFPNRQLLDSAGAAVENCEAPRNMEDLSRCLGRCLREANCGIAQKFAQVKYAVLIDNDLTIERGTLTPSMKVVADRVTTIYRGTLDDIYSMGDSSGEPGDEKVYVIPLTSK